MASRALSSVSVSADLERKIVEHRTRRYPLQAFDADIRDGEGFNCLGKRGRNGTHKQGC